MSRFACPRTSSRISERSPSGSKRHFLTVPEFSESLAPVFAAKDIQHKPIVYPPSPRVDHVDIYHGTRVPDAYRWLEDMQSPQTKAWIEAQNKVTFNYLSEIPSRPKIRQRLTNTGFNVCNSPFGYFNEFKLHVAGPSLAKVFVEI